MDGTLSLTSIGFLVLLVIIVVVVQQVQQNAQYKAIQQRLQELRETELREERARELRSERAQLASQLEAFELSLQSRKIDQLADSDAVYIEQIRQRIKSINDEITGLRQWMGIPFDLEWSEIAERAPKTHSLLLAYDFSHAMQAAPDEDETQMQLPSQ